MLSYGELKKGVVFVHEGQPYEVLESGFLRMQQRKAVMQTKIKNLITGKIVDRNWQASDEFEEAEIERLPAAFIYANRGEYWFHEEGRPQKRFQLSADVLGPQAAFLKQNATVSVLMFNGKPIRVQLPIKMDLEVIEAPPSVKGNTAQGGTKQVMLEGGVRVSAPLFISAGDIVRVNTQTGEYVERLEKR